MGRRKQRRHASIRNPPTMPEPPPDPDRETFYRKNHCRKALLNLRLDYHKSILKLMEDHLSMDNSISAFHCLKGKIFSRMGTTDYYESSVHKRAEYLTKARESLATAASLSPNSNYIAYTHAMALFLNGIIEFRMELLEAGVQEAERGLEICEPIDPEEDRLDYDENILVPTPEGRIDFVRTKLQYLISDIKATLECESRKRNQDVRDTQEHSDVDEEPDISSPKNTIDIEATEKIETQMDNDTDIGQDAEKKQELTDSNEGSACTKEHCPRQEDPEHMKNCNQSRYESDEMHLATDDKEDGNAAEGRTAHCNDAPSQPQLHTGRSETVEGSGSESKKNVINEKNGSKEELPPHQEDPVVPNPTSHDDSNMGYSFERKSCDQIVKESEEKNQQAEEDNKNANTKESPCIEKKSPYQKDPEHMKSYDQLQVEFVKMDLAERHDDIHAQQEGHAGGSEPVETTESLSKKNIGSEGLESLDTRLCDIERGVRLGLQHLESLSTATEKRFDQLEAKVGTNLDSIERKSQTTLEHLSYIETHLASLNDHVATLLDKKA